MISYLLPEREKYLWQWDVWTAEKASNTGTTFLTQKTEHEKYSDLTYMQHELWWVITWEKWSFAQSVFEWYEVLPKFKLQLRLKEPLLLLHKSEVLSFQRKLESSYSNCEYKSFHWGLLFSISCSFQILFHVFSLFSLKMASLISLKTS